MCLTLFFRCIFHNAGSYDDEDDVGFGAAAAAQVTDDEEDSYSQRSSRRGDDDEDDHDEGEGADGSNVDDANPQSAASVAATTSSSAYLSTDPTTVCLVVPNSQLTRPGDWRYDSTPLRSHDWSSGCQRMRIFDGRVDGGGSRMAHDRLHLHSSGGTSSSGSWTDLAPSRGTAAVIGVLNVRDCRSTDDLRRAEEELEHWTRLYAAGNTSAGSVNTGGDGDADASSCGIVRRLFVFDSFDEQSQHVDLTTTTLGSNLVAFPPSDANHSHMMDLHLNVVVNDLAVAIFRNLESRIRSLVAPRKAGFFSGFGGGNRAEEPSGPASGLGLSAISNIIGGEMASTGSENEDRASDDVASSGGSGGGRLSGLQKLAGGIASNIAAPKTVPSTSVQSASGKAGSPGNAYLTTPMDAYIDPSKLSSKELDALAKRDAARREKLAADLSLLAGSPIDAYERYTHAAEMTKSNHDPLWYAASLEGCAASFVAMADAGGHGVDEYLENNFQLPEDVMALALAVQAGSADGSGRNKGTVDKTKTTLPLAVFALTDEALSILSRHEKLGGLYAELLLRLAWYAAEVEEGHLRCRWGEGDECYGGDGGEQAGGTGPSIKRWQSTSVARLDLNSILVGSRGALLGEESLERSQKFVGLLHRAVSAGALDPRTRADVAATAARMCLIGVKVCLFFSCAPLSRVIQWQSSFPIRTSLASYQTIPQLTICYLRRLLSGVPILARHVPFTIVFVSHEKQRTSQLSLRRQWPQPPDIIKAIIPIPTTEQLIFGSLLAIFTPVMSMASMEMA